MTAKTNYAETLALKFLVTADSITRPTAWYMALHSANPTEAGNVGELTETGYARQSVAFSVTDDTADNTALLTFGPATEDWPEATHGSIWDAATGGNCLFQGALGAAKTVLNGDKLEFAAGSVTLTEA